MSAWQAIVKGRFPDGNETRTMFTFEATDAWGEGEHSALVTYLGAFYTAAAPSMSNDWDGYSVEVVKLDGFNAEPVEEFAFTASGSVSGEMLPHTCAYLLIGKTATKKTQGKKYIPGVPESLQNAGIAAVAAVEDMEDAAAAYIATTGTVPDRLVPGVYSKSRNSFHPFTGSRVPNVLATQRRRRQGRGI